MAKKVSKKKASKKKKNSKRKKVQQEVSATPLTVEIHELINFTPEERIKYVRATNTAVKALSSRKFYNEFMKMTFTSNKGLTNLQIYEMLMSGADNFNKTEDKDIDLFITMYYKNNNVVGYTNPGTCKIWANRKFFAQYTDAEIARNMIHEYFHKMGFDHKNAKEKTSLPYAVGELLERIIEEGFDEPVEALPPVEEPVVVPEPQPEPEPVEETPAPVVVKKTSVLNRLARWFRNLF